jgi:hypothetical protein
MPLVEFEPTTAVFEGGGQKQLMPRPRGNYDQLTVPIRWIY